MPEESAAPKIDSAKMNLDVESRMRAMSRRSFLMAGGAVVAAVGGLLLLDNCTEEAGVIWPLRKALRFDDSVTSALYSPTRLSKTYSESDITEARPNDIGDLDGDFDPSTWNLTVEGVGETPLTLTLKDIQALPREEFITEFKCIEGWSYFMKWAGARFIDFHAKYAPQVNAKFAAFETPAADPENQGGYYVSIDMPSALHPQTLLAYEMNGKPLAQEHGAPLRLLLPHKYGVKNLKRIGTIRFQDKEPPDYWAEQGYDSFAGL